MAARDIDEYLAGIDEPQRGALQQLRVTIRELVPEATETISYACPAFRIGRTTVAGFAAFRNHSSYLPHSGSVLPALDRELAGFTRTKSALHFPVDRTLERELVEKLLRVRMQQAGLLST